MEYDLELFMNCQNSKMNNGIYKMNSESSASSVSSSDNTFLNFVNLPCATPFLNNHINRNSGNLARGDQIESSNSEILGNISVAADKTGVTNTSIPNSCSLIFSTAASFNINQQDTVVYARESIRLLAKCLAIYSDHLIFRQLYAYAPDNLAWLWAFFDWETPIELNKVSYQDHFHPFGWCDEPEVIRASASGFNPEQLDSITRIFAESPLIQYKYRQELMIGDLYKFMEHVQNITCKPIAASLFCLYFPRFAPFIENPFKKFLNPKILKSNLSLINDLDNMLIKLMSTRYNNIGEYKQRIFLGPQGLPSYVSDVLSEMNFWQSNTTSNIFLMNMLKSGMNSTFNTASTVKIANSSSNFLTAKNSSEEITQAQDNSNNSITRILQNLELKKSGLKATSTSPNCATNLEDFFKTLTYLRILKSNKINCHLDYDSFDEKNASSHEMSNNEDELTGMDEDPTTSVCSKFQDLRLSALKIDNRSTIDQINSIISPTHLDNEIEQSKDHFMINKDQQDTFWSFRYGSRLACMSPPPPSTQSAARIIVNTPQTPNTTSPTSFLGQKAADRWTSTFKTNSLSRLNLTPPPSASKTANDTSFYVDPLASTFINTEIQKDDLNNDSSKSILVSSPIPFANHMYGQAPNSSSASGKREVNSSYFSRSKPPPGFNILPSEDFSNASENFALEGHTSHLGVLNINTNYTSTSSSIYSPVLKSPRDSNGNLYTPIRQRIVNETIAMISPQSMSTSMVNMKQWTGRLPPKTYPANAIYSRKVFLGGLPWDLNQNTLVQTLFKYGSVRLEVPGKDSKHPRVSNSSRTQLERLSPGYVYVIFDNEVAVTRLLADCRKENRNGSEHYFFNIFIPPLATNDPRTHMNSSGYSSHHHQSNRRGKLKEVEVIPWNQEDSSYVPPFGTDAPPPKIESSLTVFVGGLHGMCNAQGLATFMADVFGEVIHAGLDVDKYKYPIGSGRVTFRNRQSYVKAIIAHFVNVKANQETNDPSPKFEKNIQIEPYLDDCRCSKCDLKAQLFCRNQHCLQNFCANCWTFQHDQSTSGDHIALTRQNKNNNHGF